MGRTAAADDRRLVEDALEYLRWVRDRRLAAGPVTPPPSPAPSSSPAPDSAADSLERIAAEVAVCRACPLHLSRTRTVPGEGPLRPELMAIGEGPGADEDRQGRPFVGRAGKMLTDMLEKVLLLPRESVYIANTVKCRPPKNRNPEPGEIAACRPFLDRQLALVRPRSILILGKVAAQNLLDTTVPISRLRGRTFDFCGVEAFPIYHPAYLLRNPEDKRQTLEDLRRLKARLDELREGAG